MTHLLLLVLAITVAGTWSSRELSGRAELLARCTIAGVVRTARCGSVEVPEAYDAPTGRRLSLRVVLIEGNAALAQAIATRFDPSSAPDLLFVDQRGTGASHPLNCEPPAATSALMGRLFDVQRLRRCRDELARTADLRQYTTSTAATDYARVLDALKYPVANIWGVSYGTRLAMEIVRQSPSRARTVVLEAPVPFSFAWPTTGARDADAALNALIGDCEADVACAKRYPSFRQDVDVAFANVGTRRVTTAVVDPRSGHHADIQFGTSDLAYATRGLLYGAEALQLPRLFRAAAAGDYEGFAHAYVRRARTLGEDIATGVHLGVYCAEDLPYVDAAAAGRVASRTRLGTYLLDQYTAACGVWPWAPVPAGFRAPLATAVPTLILTGRRDPVTPPWTAAIVAKSLTDVRVVTWPAGGHGYDGAIDDRCKTIVIAHFVRTPRAAPDESRCSKQLRPFTP